MAIESIDEIYAPVFVEMSKLQAEIDDINRLIADAKVQAPVVEAPPPISAEPIQIDSKRPLRDSFFGRVRKYPVAAGLGIVLAGSLAVGTILSKAPIVRATEYIQCVVGRLRVSSDTIGLNKVGNDFVVNDLPPEDCSASAVSPAAENQDVQWVPSPNLGVTHPPMPTLADAVAVKFPTPVAMEKIVPAIAAEPIVATPVVEPAIIAAPVVVEAPLPKAPDSAPVVVAAPPPKVEQLSPQEQTFRKFTEQTVVIANPGETFGGNLTVPDGVEDWEGPIKKKDYISEVVRILAADNGVDLNLVYPGEIYPIKELLREDQLPKLREALAINDPHYAYQLSLR